MDGLSVEEYSGMEYGIKTDHDIAEGELMIAVPRKIMLCQESSAQSVLGKVLVY